MVLEMKENIRLDNDLTTNLPTNTYEVLLDGYEDIHRAAVVTERGLTGKLLAHRRMTGGVPDKWTDRSYNLLLTRAQKDTLVAHDGMVCYFMPLYRDDAVWADYRETVLLQVNKVKMFDPQQDWWQAAVTLEDASGLSVD